MRVDNWREVCGCRGNECPMELNLSGESSEAESDRDILYIFLLLLLLMV